MGLIWRVGNGSIIKINDTPWMSNQPTFRVHMREGTYHNIERVEHLMLSNSRRWNTELIDTIFNPNEAALIKQIPLAQGNAQDIMA